MANTQYYVYRNLNDAADVLVLDGEQVSIGIYELAAGPFDDKAEAEAEAEKLRRAKPAS